MNDGEGGWPISDCYSSTCSAVELFDAEDPTISISGYYDQNEGQEWYWPNGRILYDHTYERDPGPDAKNAMLHGGFSSDSGRNRVEEYEVTTKEGLVYVCPAMTCNAPIEGSTNVWSTWELDLLGTNSSSSSVALVWRVICALETT